jgi:hypothetical protein
MLHRTAGMVDLTDEVIGSAATNDVDGGNDIKGIEDLPSLAPYLHTNSWDIRQGLACNEEH